MKCIECGKEFEPEREKETIKVVLSNPGTINFETTVVKCPHCKQSYTEGEEDILKLAEDFDKACTRLG